jgi:hypothetical protein
MVLLAIGLLLVDFLLRWMLAALDVLLRFDVPL